MRLGRFRINAQMANENLSGIDLGSGFKQSSRKWYRGLDMTEVRHNSAKPRGHQGEFYSEKGGILRDTRVRFPIIASKGVL